MTAAQMVLEFKLGLDKMDSSAYPDILESEILFWLNEAQEQFVRNRYGLVNIYGKGFEEIQKRIDDLSNIVVTKFAAVTALTTEENTYRVSTTSLFNDEAHLVSSTNTYMYFIRGRAKVVKGVCTPVYFGINLEQHDDLDQVLIDPFKKPDSLNPVGYFEEGDLFIITDGTFTINNFKLTFIRIPVAINTLSNPDVDCELKPSTHKEIVRLAVNLALENIESRRLQTQTQQLNKE